MYNLLSRLNLRTYEDFEQFSTLHVECKDIDPVYYVLEELHEILCRDEEDKLWLSLVYVTYYNIASGLQTYLRHPTPTSRVWDLSVLPTGTERRSLRGGKNLVKHLESLIELRAKFGSFESWIKHEWVTRDQQERNWTLTRETLEQAWGNGRWATYKTAEILQKVHKWPITPVDMGNEFSSGPRKGLERLYTDVPDGNTRQEVQELDEMGQLLLDFLDENNLPVDIAEVETLLCDFNSLCKGKFYVGNDTMELLHKTYSQERKGLMSKVAFDTLLQAVSKSLPEEVTRQFKYWSEDAHKTRQKHYALTGHILHPNEGWS